MAAKREQRRIVTYLDGLPPEGDTSPVGTMSVLRPQGGAFKPYPLTGTFGRMLREERCRNGNT